MSPSSRELGAGSPLSVLELIPGNVFTRQNFPNKGNLFIVWGALHLLDPICTVASHEFKGSSFNTLLPTKNSSLDEP